MIGYDLKLNAKETKFYNFLDKDNFTLESILMFKVNYQTFLNILEYQGEVSEEFYNQIKDRGFALLSDTKSNVVIKVSPDRQIRELYYLDIKSDLDILELSYNFPKIDKFFKKGKIREVKRDNQKEEMRIYLSKMVEEEKDRDKLKYLLCEWNERAREDIDKIKKILRNKINGKMDKEYVRIYKLVKFMNEKRT